MHSYACTLLCSLQAPVGLPLVVSHKSVLPSPTLAKFRHPVCHYYTSHSSDWSLSSGLFQKTPFTFITKVGLWALESGNITSCICLCCPLEISVALLCALGMEPKSTITSPILCHWLTNFGFLSWVIESISIKFLLGPLNLDYISSFHGLTSTFHFALLLLYNCLSAMQLLHVYRYKNKNSSVFIHTGSFFPWQVWPHARCSEYIWWRNGSLMGNAWNWLWVQTFELIQEVPGFIKPWESVVSSCWSLAIKSELKILWDRVRFNLDAGIFYLIMVSDLD